MWGGVSQGGSCGGGWGGCGGGGEGGGLVVVSMVVVMVTVVVLAVVMVVVVCELAVYGVVSVIVGAAVHTWGGCGDVCAGVGRGDVLDVRGACGAIVCGVVCWGDGCVWCVRARP